VCRCTLIAEIDEAKDWEVASRRMKLLARARTRTLAFSFVAPLRADDHHIRHVRISLAAGTDLALSATCAFETRVNGCIGETIADFARNASSHSLSAASAYRPQF